MAAPFRKPCSNWAKSTTATTPARSIFFRKTARPIPDSNIQRSNSASTTSNSPVHANGALAGSLALWNRLDLDTFWQPLLTDSQKGTPGLKVLKTLVVYRLLDPGSEWRLHRFWFDRSAMADLLSDDFPLAAKDTLYRCHDHLLDHREALVTHFKERWAGLFGACYEILGGVSRWGHSR